MVILVSASDADIKGQQLIDQFGITGLPPRVGIKGIPNINITGFNVPTQSLLNPVNDGHAQFADNLTWVRGRHSMKFGVEELQWFDNRWLTTNAGLFGNITFTGRFTGSPYADFLLGLPNTVTRLDPYPTQYNRWSDWNFYAQDDFKVTPRLTALSYGLRYEFNQPVHTTGDNIYSFDLATGKIIVPSQASFEAFSPFFPTNCPSRRPTRWAWATACATPTRKFRAPVRLLLPVGIERQDGAARRLGHVLLAFLGQCGRGPGVGTLRHLYGQHQQRDQWPDRVQSRGALPVAEFSRHTQPDSRQSAPAQQLRAPVQPLAGARIDARIGLRVSYIGSKGTQLVYERNANQPGGSTTAFAQARRPYPLYSNITYADNGANSLYSALQAQVQKRFTQGLLFSFGVDVGEGHQRCGRYRRFRTQHGNRE